MSAPVREAARILREIRRQRGLDVFRATAARMPAEDLAVIARAWELTARATQLRPAYDGRDIWVRVAGRGEGKTRSAVEDQLNRMEDLADGYRGILINKNYGDLIKVGIHGKSGFLACAHRRGYSLKVVHGEHARIEHPSGGRAYFCTPEKPEGPRGYEATDFWCDEIAFWPNAIDTWDNLMFAWRIEHALGRRGIVTTTPRPSPIMSMLLRDVVFAKQAIVTRGRTFDNAANLPAKWLASMVEQYGGTKRGLAELEGELLELAALVDLDLIERFRVTTTPELVKTVVAIDPGIRRNEKADETGIIAAGRDTFDKSAHAYVLEDASIQGASFSQWARRAVDVAVAYGAIEIVTEINQGGDGGATEAVELAVQANPRAAGIHVVSVWATTGKRTRAELVAPLYERGRVHHVNAFPQLEKEWSTWTEGAPSPNRLDAAVYALTALLIAEQPLPMYDF